MEIENTNSKVILVKVNITNKANELNNDKTLDELSDLAIVLNLNPVFRLTQNKKSYDQKYYIGYGKISELKNLIDVYEASAVIFDDPLSPLQLRNLEELLDTEVYDRSYLILQIFKDRAINKQSRLEVELANKKYMLPRLIGLGKVLSRQGGGSFNSRGPGETMLELQKRKLQEDIFKIENELNKLEISNLNSRKKMLENNIPIISLFGYTNVGKSSLMNSLAKYLNAKKDDVFVENKVFATLSTKYKKMNKDKYPPFLLLDTVGIISKLPIELIRSFNSTLKETLDAELILIVVDPLNDPFYQIENSLNILNSIGASNIKKLIVFTKADKIDESFALNINEEHIIISNETGYNIDNLVNLIYSNIYSDIKHVSLKLNYDDLKIIDEIKEKGFVLSFDYLDNYILVKAFINKELLSKYESKIVSR
ncbi:GTPase HflX [Haploplasma modicum]|uniref:GTPase HflX n=1 Tax=Haploplasma modicum TaxID=2150 RepID=UPI00214AF953|nr:GTPase HflX [Haploplasma modicum]MCR1809094.1 GTPase HflX [Haploplasma modicum]